MNESRASSLVLAGALFLMGVGAGWLLFRPSTGPKHDLQGRNQLAKWAWKNARPLYLFVEKGFLLLGGLGCLAGSFYCVKLAASGR